MTAILIRLRSEVRARWRAWASLALITGVAAGAAIAAASGARRSETAYPRFLRAQDGFHALTGGGGDLNYDQRLATLKSLPEIADLVQLDMIGAGARLPAQRGRPVRALGFLELLVQSDPSGRYLYETNRAKILEGRLADRARAAEVSVPFSFARRHDIRVGDEISVAVGFDERFEPLRYLPVEVVGIHAAPGDFEAVGQTGFPIVVVTPVFVERHRELLPPPGIPDLVTIGVHLDGGAVASAAFKTKVESSPINIDVPLTEPVALTGVQKTMRLYGAALWIVAGLIALATLSVVGQTMVRQIHLDSFEYPTLRALGMTRSQLFTLGLVRAAGLVLMASPVAAAVAYVLSPLLPIGDARVAELDLGLRFDASPIMIGIAIMIGAIMLVAVWPSWRAARLASVSWSSATEPQRLSLMATFAARTIQAPSAAIGLRMALEPGRGRTAVPVRSTVLAVAVGLAAVMTTLGVGRSMVHLIDTPELAGFTYDAILPNESELSDEVVEQRLRRLPFIERLARGTGLNVNIGGVDSFIVGFNYGAPIGYATIAGGDPTPRMRDGLPEISVGPTTARRMGLDVGDVVTFVFPRHEEGREDEVRVRQRAVVVGVAAIPPLPWAAVPPGEGGVMTTEAIDSFAGDSGGCCFVRFREGTELTAARAALQDAGFDTFLRTTRADLVTLEQIAGLPVALTLIFTMIALAALTHVLVTGIRRRRRDLAILKTLGMRARQVRASIAWQASALAALCLAIGMPVGIVFARWAWRAVADQFGVVPVSVLPLTMLVLAIPAVLVLANVIALGPARAAARTEPAIVLRSE